MRRCNSATTAARDALVEQQAAGTHGVIVEARYQVLGLEASGLHGAFGVHAEEDGVEQHLEQRLILIVAAGSGERDDRLIGRGDEGGAERHARALAGGEFVGMAGHQQETLRALGQRNAGVADQVGGHPRARRRRRKRDAVLIDGVHAGGVLGHQGIGNLVALDLGVEGMLADLVADLAGAELERRLFGDQLAALGGVLLAEQHGGGNLVELGVAVVGVAVGVGELEGFDRV